MKKRLAIFAVVLALIAGVCAFPSTARAAGGVQNLYLGTDIGFISDFR